MSVKPNAFGGLRELMRQMNNLLKETEKEVNTVEFGQAKELLNKYDVVLKDDIDEKDLVLKYETFYDQLNEYVINKKKEINDVEETINTVPEFKDGSNYTIVVNKKKDNANRIIDCINRIVERIRDLETTIYNNRVNELNNMKVERYDVDLEMDIIKNSMDMLKRWSNKNTFNVIFDSRIDGDGSNNVLYNRIWNKSNLCFITFDESDNVYGGYLNTKIDKSGNDINKPDDWIYDRNSFVFSLIRNGKVINKRYFYRQSYDGRAFFLWNNLPNLICRFGNDVVIVCKVGSDLSWCSDDKDYCYYEYNNDDNKPFTDITHPNTFVVQRIVVVEMN